MRIAAIALIACTRIVHDPVPPAVVRVVEPCLELAPPRPPREAGLCAEPAIATEDECQQMKTARRADYSYELQRWVELYAWPRCRSSHGGE